MPMPTPSTNHPPRATRRHALLALAALATLSIPLPAARARAASPVLRIAASTPVFADIAASVGGERVEVWSVIPTGADPHTWEASAQDMARVGDYDLFISMGAHLEPFIEAGGWRRAVQDASVPQLVLAEHLDLIAVDRIIDHGDHTHDLRGGDPHVWLDPRMGEAVVQVIAAALAAADPEGASRYAANADRDIATLREIDARYVALVAEIPEDRRQLIVFHDAFTYFAERYGFTVIGVVLPHTDGEASAQDLAAIVETVRREEVPVIFAEPHFPTDLLDAIAAETGAEVGYLMTDTFANGVDSYPGLLEFNLTSLRALVP